jgi:hypothetical protein
MSEVSIVLSWWDDQQNECRTIVAVYDEREAALAWVANQQKQARDNPALIMERDHKHWEVKVMPVLE